VNTPENIRDRIERIKRASFNDDYQATDEEAMGILLSRFFDYDGIAILKAASFGLEDANFHTLNAEVGRLIKREQARFERQIRQQKKAMGAS
jgi:hypothetical protein